MPRVEQRWRRWTPRRLTRSIFGGNATNADIRTVLGFKRGRQDA